jgi:hypothetical protein
LALKWPSISPHLLVTKVVPIWSRMIREEEQGVKRQSRLGRAANSR